MYRASLVEECRHELEIREKSSSFAEMVAAMDDAKIREILAHPQLYAEELIYACSQEHVERDRIRQEQQEREAEAARLERERKAEEERIAREQRKKEEAERRAVAWKKQRPYVFAVIAILVLAGIGVGGYSYYKEQNRLKQERIAAEQQRVAEELRAEQQRIAEEKAAEQRRIAAEKKREQQRIAAEQQRIAAEKAAEERRIAEEKAAEERRIAAENRIKNGIFEIGDIHPKLKGVVFWVSDSKKWGKVISLQETTSPQYKSFSWCKNLGANWRLPRLYELRQIYQSKDIINATLSQTGGDKLSEKTYWSEEDMGRNYIGTFDMKNGRNGQTFRKETAYQMRAVSVFQ